MKASAENQSDHGDGLTAYATAGATGVVANRPAASNGRRRSNVRTRLVPPVGYPLHSSELWMAARSVITRSRTRRRARRALCDYLGVRRVWLYSSGRAALTVALRGLAAARPERRQVVLPAYTCYSVAGAVARAGLTVRLVDLIDGTFEIDPEALARVTGPETLALIAPHLLGYPMDLHPFREVATEHGACLIDDAAQALGARLGGRPCGAGGDIGILSFGRGKPLTTLGGGALVCDNPELISLLEPSAHDVGSPGRLASTMAAAQAGIYTQLLHPRIYWLPSRLPFLKIGQTKFETDFPIRNMPAFKFGLLRGALRRLDMVNERRRLTAERLDRGLAGLAGSTPIAAPSNGFSFYLRYPLLLPDGAAVDRAIAALRDAGVSAGRLYPRPLNHVPEVADCSPDHGGEFPHAERLARCLLTLPTYPHVDAGTVATICAVLRETLADHRAPMTMNDAGDAGAAEVATGTEQERDA